MPLIILGLLLVICLLVYTIIRYRQEFKDSGDKLVDKLADFYEHIINSFNKSSTTFTTEEADEGSEEESEEKKTLLFPTENAELEKHKRNIH